MLDYTKEELVSLIERTPNQFNEWKKGKEDEIDLSDLAIIVRKIHDAYDKPIAEYQMSKAREKLGALPMDKLTSFMTAASTAASATAHVGK